MVYGAIKSDANTVSGVYAIVSMLEMKATGMTRMSAKRVRWSCSGDPHTHEGATIVVASVRGLQTCCAMQQVRAGMPKPHVQ